MRIEELEPGQALVLLVNAGNHQLEFSSSVLEAFPRKHMILATPILKNDKIISFSGEGVTTHVVVYRQDHKPCVFQKVNIQTARDRNDKFCYMISSPSESKDFNRRGAFRCYIGIDAHVRVGSEKGALEAIIKDVSATGFAFALRSGPDLDTGESVHAILNDYIEETGKSYSFHLVGTIVRSYEMDSGRMVYGCQFKAKILGLDTYLVEKERIRLQKNRTSGNIPPREK